MQNIIDYVIVKRLIHSVLFLLNKEIRQRTRDARKQELNFPLNFIQISWGTRNTEMSHREEMGKTHSTRAQRSGEKITRGNTKHCNTALNHLA